MTEDRKDGPHAPQDMGKDAREGGTFLDPKDAKGHTLPESERDQAELGSGRHDNVTAAPTTIPPPD